MAGGDDVLVGWQRGRVAARPDEPVVRRDELLDVARHPHLRVRRGRRRSRTPARGPTTTCDESTTLNWSSATASIRAWRNSRRASGSRLATGSSRTSSSGRLASPRVSASCARCPPDSRPARCRGSRRSCRTRGCASASSHRGLRPGAERQVLGDGQPWVDRRVLGDVADLGQLGGVPRRATPRRPRSRRRRARAGRSASPSRVVLPAPFGPTRPVTRPAGIVQRAVPQRPAAPVALAEASGPQHGGHATPSVSARRTVANSASTASSSRPAERALVSQRCSSRRRGSIAATDSVGQRAGHEGADAGPGGREPSCSSSR